MFGKNYATAYAILFVIALLPALVSTAWGSPLRGSTIVVVLIVAAVLPFVLIWLARKMGYPIGQAVHCSRCNAEQPMVRRPANMRQALYGGYHCSKCGADLDARGRERTSGTGRS